MTKTPFSEVAGTVDAARAGLRRPAAAFDFAQHGRAHVAPARDEGREAPGLAADDEQVDVLRARHDRDVRVELALVPDREAAVVDLAVAVVEGELAELVARVHPQVVLDVVALPAVLGDRGGVLGSQHHGTVAARDRVVVREGAHRRADGIEDALRVVGDVVGDAVRRLGRHHEHRRVLGLEAFLDVVGSEPPQFSSTRRMARPMVALARLPEPKALQPAFMPIFFAMGPFTTRSGEAMCVVACTPFRLKAGSHKASMAARTTGAYSGLQPARTMLIASTSRVRPPQRGGTRASSFCGSPPSASSTAATLAGVGGTTGRPSE